MKRLTVIVPVHNEEGNLAPLVARLQAAAARLDGWALDVLFVDDGSTDGTAAALEALRGRGLPVGHARLARNVGHQSALAAGLALAQADAVVTMDGDLQHPPEDLPRMVAAFEQGADVVQMVRATPAAGGKGWLSRAFYRFFAQVAHTEIVPDAADFRLLSARVVDVLNRIPEREKFFRALVPSLGFRQVALAYEERDRHSGTPSYGFWQSLRLAQKALFDYSTLPLRAVFWLGTALAVTSFLFGVGHVVVKLLAWQRIEPGFTDLITATLFLSGCILAALGVLGRYMILILEQVRGRPPYVVAEHRPGQALPPAAPGAAGR